MMPIKCATRRFSAVMGVVSVAAALGLPQAAEARTVIPATACQRAADSVAPASAVEYTVSGAVRNDSSTDRLVVVCPIPRSNTSTHPNWFRVYGRDNHYQQGTNGSLGCRVRSNNRWSDGNTLDSQSYATSSTVPSVSDYSPYFHHVDSADENGNYTVTCYLPPKDGSLKSWIGSIVIDEPN